MHCTQSTHNKKNKRLRSASLSQALQDTSPEREKKSQKKSIQHDTHHTSQREQPKIALYYKNKHYAEGLCVHPGYILTQHRILRNKDISKIDIRYHDLLSTSTQKHTDILGVITTTTHDIVMLRSALSLSQPLPRMPQELESLKYITTTYSILHTLLQKVQGHFHTEELHPITTYQGTFSHDGMPLGTCTLDHSGILRGSYLATDRPLTLSLDIEIKIIIDDFPFLRFTCTRGSSGKTVLKSISKPMDGINRTHYATQWNSYYAVYTSASHRFKPPAYPDISNTIRSMLKVLGGVGPSDLSRHHIIPKAFMKYLWTLMPCGKNSTPTTEMWLRKLIWPQHENYSNGLLSVESVVWAPWNIFIGPSYRTHDTSIPGADMDNNVEEHRPLSFPKTLWGNIKKLYKALFVCFKETYKHHLTQDIASVHKVMQAINQHYPQWNNEPYIHAHDRWAPLPSKNITPYNEKSPSKEHITHIHESLEQLYKTTWKKSPAHSCTNMQDFLKQRDYITTIPSDWQTTHSGYALVVRL